MREILNGLRHTRYIYSHPFDGFWVMKKERKGNIKSAAVLLALFVVTTAYRFLCSGYLFTSPMLSKFSIWLLAAAVVVLVLLYCVSNWALTTLMDGKGSFAEVCMALMYALTPITLMNIPITVLSQVFVAEEAAFISFLNAIAVIWTVFLLLAGNVSVHEYTMVKSIVTLLLTVAGMAVIAVLAILAGNLVQQVWIWAVSIIKELAFRL